MPGHVKRGGSGDPDPDPLPFLIVSSSDRQKDLAKASFSFLLQRKKLDTMSTTNSLFVDAFLIILEIGPEKTEHCYIAIEDISSNWIPAPGSAAIEY